MREIGRGGMGVVYEALQQHPRRPVALKVILGGRHVDAATVRMFQREADSLARLKHPAIASIYESGCTGEGQHYFAMELVRGRMLSEFLDESGALASRGDLRRRLALFRKIAAAVAYAHQRGVIHRDLKPSNIMVLQRVERPATGSLPDAADEVPDIKVLDFGLARITDPEAGAATAITALGGIMGTIPYMSPEQVRGGGDEIDARTDVYSLGVVLYRMLAGRLPLDLEGAGITEAARIVSEDTPRPLRRAAGGRLRLDRDLSIIVLKALEKEPARRYQTVAALDEDVARYLDGQPILARRPSAAYQLRKLVSRHTVAFAAAGALVALLLGVAAVATVQARRIAAERDRANRETATARRVSGFLTDLFNVSDPNEARGSTITAREILDRGVLKIDRDLADEPETQARMMLTMGRVYLRLGLFSQATPILERTVAIRRRLLGDDHRDTLEAMESLALQYGELGRFAESEAIFVSVLETRRRLQGDEHPETLETMNNLASAWRQVGRHTEEEVLKRKVFETRRRILGDDDPATLASMADLADACWMLQRYDEAEALYRPALEGLRRVLGPDHRSTLATMNDMGLMFLNQGREAEAETIFSEALDRMRRVLGADHPVTLSATNSLGVVYDHQERNAEAEAMFRRALEGERRILGEDHGDTIDCMSNLANTLSVEGRYAEAETLLQEVLEKDRRMHGPGSIEAIKTLYNLGCTAALRGDRAAALDWLGQAVAVGYARPEKLERDSDLTSLRGDPRFATSVARARTNAAPPAVATATEAAPPPAEGTRADDDPVAHLEFLAGDALKGRATFSPGFARAAVYIRDRLIRQGFKGANSADPANPYYQGFDIYTPRPEMALAPTGAGPAGAAPREPELFERGFLMVDGMSEGWQRLIRRRMKPPGTGASLADLRAAAQRLDRGFNVVGTCAGTSKPDEYIVGMAHLDGFVGVGKGIYNAADDNASGSATLLASVPALARLCREGALQRSMLLVWTDAEEFGSLGAAALVLTPLPGIPPAAMKGVVNLDMVGRRGNDQLSVIDTAPDGAPVYLRDLLRQANATLRPPFERINRDIENHRLDQDQRAFDVDCEADCPPVLFLFEGLSNPAGGGTLIPEMHTPADDDTLIRRDNEGEKMRRVSRLLVAILQAAANR